MRALILLACSVFTLTACAKVNQELASFQDIFNPRVNMTEYNYAAADALVGQAGKTLSLNDPIAIGALHPVNLKPNEKIPPFGKTAADQIAARLTQLGYNIRETGVGVQTALAMDERAHLDTARANNAVAAITGNYTISTRDILMNIRITRLEDGRVLSATDYRVPLGSDTYEMIGRDPFYGLPEKPVTNPDARMTGTPLPSRDLPVTLIP